MKPIPRILLAASCAATLAAGAAGAAGVRAAVVNGGFETGDFTGWTTIDASPLGASYYGVDTAGPRHGSYSAFFGGSAAGDAIQQAVDTTPGGSYTLSFWLDAGAATAAGSFVARVNGTTVYDAPAGALAFGAHTVSFVATSASTLLNFAAFNRSDFYTLDDVALSAVTAVPEPGTWAMAGAGLLAMALYRRRRMT